MITILGSAGAGALAAAVPDRAGGTKPGVDRGGVLHVDPNYPFRFRLANGKLVPVRPKAFALRGVGRRIEARRVETALH